MSLEIVRIVNVDVFSKIKVSMCCILVAAEKDFMVSLEIEYH